MNNENENKKLEEKISLVVLFALVLGISFYLAKTFDEDADIRVDFEKKSYIPYTVNSEIYLINKYNGKTYKLEKKEINDTYFFEYRYLAAPKIRKRRLYLKNDKLNLKKEEL